MLRLCLYAGCPIAACASSWRARRPCDRAARLQSQLLDSARLGQTSHRRVSSVRRPLCPGLWVPLHSQNCTAQEPRSCQVTGAMHTRVAALFATVPTLLQPLAGLHCATSCKECLSKQSTPSSLQAVVTDINSAPGVNVPYQPLSNATQFSA